MKDKELPSDRNANKARALWAITRGKEPWPGSQEVALSLFEEVDAAIQRAKQTLIERRSPSPQVIFDFGQYVAEGLETQRDDLVRWAAKETGLEVAQLHHLLSQNLLLWQSDSPRFAYDDRALQDWMSQNALCPVGFMSCGSPKSIFFPVGNASMAVLMAGYPILYMTEPGHVGTDHLLARIIWSAAERVGWKASCFQLLISEGATMAKTFIQHPDSSILICSPRVEDLEDLKALANQRLPPFQFYRCDDNSMTT